MVDVVIRRFTDDEAEAVASWRYPPPFDRYDGDPFLADDYHPPTEGADGYYVLVIDGRVVGFCCFGEEARVVGQTADDGVVDVGMGIRPDLVSSGVATSVAGDVVAFARVTFGATRLRVAVASFNERSLRLCRAAGFRVVRRFDGPGSEFHELIRDC